MGKMKVRSVVQFDKTVMKRMANAGPEGLNRVLNFSTDLAKKLAPTGDASARAITKAKRLALGKTGGRWADVPLRDSILRSRKKPGALKGTVWVMAPHGHLVELGVHPRRAKGKKSAGYMTFKTADGRWHRVKVAAGIPAQPFMAPAAIKTAEELGKILDGIIEK